MKVEKKIMRCKKPSATTLTPEPPPSAELKPPQAGDKRQYSEIEIINELSDRVDALCPRVAANSDEEVTAFEENLAFYLSRRMEVAEPLPADLFPLVGEGINAWAARWERFLNKIQKSEDEFQKDFSKLYQAYKENRPTKAELAAEYAGSCDVVVWNISWVALFAWQLPAADPERRQKYREIARQMIAVFTTEWAIKKIFDGTKDEPDTGLVRKVDGMLNIIES